MLEDHPNRLREYRTRQDAFSQDREAKAAADTQFYDVAARSASVCRSSVSYDGGEVVLNF